MRVVPTLTKCCFPAHTQKRKSNANTKNTSGTRLYGNVILWSWSPTSRGPATSWALSIINKKPCTSTPDDSDACCSFIINKLSLPRTYRTNMLLTCSDHELVVWHIRYDCILTTQWLLHYSNTMTTNLQLIQPTRLNALAAAHRHRPTAALHESCRQCPTFTLRGTQHIEHSAAYTHTTPTHIHTWMPETLGDPCKRATQGMSGMLQERGKGCKEWEVEGKPVC